MKSICSVVVVLWLILSLSFSLEIEVWNTSAIVKTYFDRYSSISERSFEIPDDGLEGMLRYPIPRNACSSIEQVDNNTWIAFVTDYLACPGDNDQYLQAAGYIMMLAPVLSQPLSLKPKSFLPQALVEESFGKYLEDNVLAVNDSSFSLRVTDEFPALFEELFLIIGAVLVIAIIASVAVFCCSIGCQWLYQKWKHRGLSQWQVRSLPKRKYNACKDSCEACSICLEEFKEGDIVRVLPCEHVFHPCCVDEWLQKWKRTCPLCKNTISRRSQPALTAESRPLLAEEQELYGSTGSDLGRAMHTDDHLQRDSSQTESITESS